MSGLIRPAQRRRLGSVQVGWGKIWRRADGSLGMLREIFTFVRCQDIVDTRVAWSVVNFVLRSELAGLDVGRFVIFRGAPYDCGSTSETRRFLR